MSKLAKLLISLSPKGLDVLEDQMAYVKTP